MIADRTVEIEESVRKLQEAVKEAKTQRESEIARREMAQKHQGEEPLSAEAIKPLFTWDDPKADPVADLAAMKKLYETSYKLPPIDWTQVKITPSQMPLVSDHEALNKALAAYAGKPAQRKYELVTLVGGQEITAHTKADCQQQDYCCIHNPSNHPLRGMRQLWRNDRNLMERVCAHGVGHPDPDDLYYKTSQGQDVRSASSHGCDGCC